MTQIGSDECFMPLLKWISIFLFIHARVDAVQSQERVAAVKTKGQDSWNRASSKL